jgi:uncharacterized protein (DUF1800 family)
MTISPRLLGLVLAALTTLPDLRAQTPSVSNLSTRAQVGTGGDILITGFNIGPGASKTVLIRATGPTLAGAPFNVPGTLADPRLELFAGANRIAENDNWSTPAGGATPVTAAHFSSVGAFPLNAGSRDAALLVTLAPGPYTAQVSGIGAGTGVALIEVYEVGALNARLTNISTRAFVGTGGNILIPGLVISPGAGTRRLLIRAAGPALASAPFNVPGTLADPAMTVLSGTTVVASNNDWGTPAGAGAASAAALDAAFAQAGAFRFATGSRDAALLADVAPGSYTIQVSGAGNTSGIAIVEVYDVSPAGPAIVSLTAPKTSANEAGLGGEFVVTRSGDTFAPLTVNYGVSGSATNGLDYPPLLGTVTIPSGATSVSIPLLPLADTTVESTESVTLTLGGGNNYALGSAVTGTVSIADSPGTLYVATLRPAASAAGSAASGLATIVLSASGTIATVNVSFSNLGSGQVGAHLFLGNSTAAGDYVLNLPLGQVTGAQWSIGPTATYTSAQILDALRNGLIYVGLDSAQHPAGELRGAFLGALGSQTFTPPGAPPAVALNGISATDAARLLMQGTFGPRQGEIEALTGGAINAWIDAQLALPATSHRARIQNEVAYLPATNPPENVPQPAHRQYAWFYNVLQGPDQLRQRVAFALSQILVVSDATLAGQQFAEPLANYYDLLVNGAFGNYRTLLEQVSLSPVMGTYLSHLRNAKADPVAGTNPDENYAREVMQLFTIGLVQLQPDGTLKLDAQGLPIPTYNQSTISEMAKVFTGWGFYSTLANPNFRRGGANYYTPMMIYPAFHETGAKNLAPLTTSPIPANLGGPEDLKRALDLLFHHPNTPPFVSRQLIQRLVTANPSPAYVYRVAQRFENNGSGVRGDLGAVVRAILTDYEARSPAVIDDPGYGKLREPLLRLTGLLRSFNATSASGHYIVGFGNTDPDLAQAPLRSPSVFNFFEPGYVFPGALAAAGLVAPEFQITNDTTAISTANHYRATIFRAAGTGANAPNIAVLNLAAEQALVTNVPALLDRLNLLMASGQLSASARTRITNALSALPANVSALERVQTAILLLATSPDGATQR